MTALLVYSALLVAAVLLSERFRRTVLSSAVLFLAGGFVVGAGGFGVVHFAGGPAVPRLIAELALFAILITDGTRLGLGLRDRSPDVGPVAWRLPVRALALGMPITIVLAAAAAHWLAGLAWVDAFLVGSVLSPTDPVFSASLVGNEAVPLRLRRLLNVESGMNDGIALPAVLVFLSVALHDDPPLLTLAGELFGGVAVGVAIPYLVARLERLRWFKRATRFDPLGPLAVTLLVYAVARTTGVNLFLSAFACGITLALCDDRGTRAFGSIAEPGSELLKLGAVFVFATLLTPGYFGDIGAGGVVFALLMLVAVRPAAILSALARSGLTRRELTVAAWSDLVASRPSPTRSWCSSRAYGAPAPCTTSWPSSSSPPSSSTRPSTCPWPSGQPGPRSTRTSAIRSLAIRSRRRTDERASPMVETYATTAVDHARRQVQCGYRRLVHGFCGSTTAAPSWRRPSTSVADPVAWQRAAARCESPTRGAVPCCTSTRPTTRWWRFPSGPRTSPWST